MFSRLRCRAFVIILFAIIFLPSNLLAQSNPDAAPPYLPFGWDQDWSLLGSPQSWSDWSDEFHFIHLGENPQNYLSFGGQIRERGEYQDYPAFAQNPAHTGYLLQRYFFDTDLHLADRFRLYLQLASSLENGRDGGPRPQVDQSTFNFNQAFVDLKLWQRGSDYLQLRSGRQLISLGSPRIVAPGLGLNVQKPFDGFRLTLALAAWKIDALAVRPTLIHSGIFENEPNYAQEFWGLYATHNFPLFLNGKVDLYYLGLDSKSARWQQGTAHEQRETVGARFWGVFPDWYYDWEFTGQFGRFGAGDIRAWGIALSDGYRFRRARWAPQISLSAGSLSGDGNPHDHTLGTFNALFPNGNYLSNSLLIGPYNVTILRPKLELDLTKKLTVDPNLQFLWRENPSDGIYNIAGILTHPANPAVTSRYVGAQIQCEVEYSFSRHLTGGLIYEHYFPGAFLKQTPPNQGTNFIAPQLQYNF